MGQVKPSSGTENRRPRSLQPSNLLVDGRHFSKGPTQAVGSAFVRLQHNFGNQFAADGMDHGGALASFKSGLVAVTLNLRFQPRLPGGSVR
jgi:hypothetical protein